MDGAMPKTVLIILAAVVALIVIVVLTGMRNLRADDEDDFDDDMPAEHGRSRSRGSHPPAASQARARQGHTADLPDKRPRERVGAARGARPIQGREDRATDRRAFDQRGMDQRGGSRADHDRAAAARDQRPVRTGRRDYDDISGPLPAARPVRSPVRDRGADDYGSSLPGRRSSSADYDRDPRERRNGRDRAVGYDELGLRSDGRDPRDTPDRRDRGDNRPSRPAATIRDDSDRGEKDRRSNTRPNSRPDSVKNGSKPDAELLPALKPRQSKNKRESEGDWPSNEWDELSDVDYWAELASDKPFTAPAPPEAPRRERRDARADRDVRQDSRTGADAITKQMSRAPREADSGILPAARHTDLPADRPAAPRTADPRPAIDEDDPLTSPSFPRVASDDSRSYRRSRSARSADPRYDGGRGPDSSRLSNGNGRTPDDLSPYPSMPPVEPVNGFDSATTTRRHALPAASADHYGSSLPSAPAYQTPDTSYGAPDGANGRYSQAEPGGYPAASYPSAASGSYPQANGSPSGDYQSLPPAPDSYWPELSAASHQGGAAYEMTGYDRTGSHALPPSPASYGNGAADRANGYQGYSGPTSASGSHRRPEPSYPDANYQAYDGYGTAAPQPPGYGANHYQPSGYDQAGHPLEPKDADGHLGADPYAVDTYGQDRYSGNGY